MALREEYGRKFRVARNIQTGPWSGYLLQEWLCRPLEREGDVTLYTSDYTRASYASYFPHPTLGHHITGFPNMLSIPGKILSSRHREYECGYFGRISKDKNFEDAVACFKFVMQAKPSSRFVIVGAPHDMDYSSHDVMDIIKRHNLDLRTNYMRPLSHHDTLDVMSCTRTVVFPSTSNVESFGRVVAEAWYCGCNVAASTHAAMPEFLKPTRMAKVHYDEGLCRSTLRHFPTGKVSPEALADLALSDENNLDSRKIQSKENYIDVLLAALDGIILESSCLQNSNIRVLGHLQGVRKLNTCEAQEKVTQIIQAMRELFLSEKTRLKCLDKLVVGSLDEDRTRRFIKLVQKWGLNICDIGGWPIEACSVVGFDAVLTLKTEKKYPQSKRDN